MQGLSVSSSLCARLFWLLFLCSLSLAHAAPPTEQETQNVIEASQRLNINQADLQQLTALPGIGPSRAAAIIELREQRGGLTDANQLLEVRGIGPVILQSLEPLISF
ncbi:helix-hairpin-helix domain-containing protein [Marinospirillum sp. MEB164]|uniref:Helix-hairpin-helix domain-containing protein n=1 Tax=Marinospirillum alkalitolerans TaxID=3123374 RepID=A0ABW8PZ54_9GAMM